MDHATRLGIEKCVILAKWQLSGFNYQKDTLSMIEMNTKVTIGLCVRNSEKEIGTALRSIIKQDFPHELMKLIVVDDGCTDKTIPLVMEFVSKIDIKTTIFSSGGKGLATSRQMVIDNAEGDYIVWVDDDHSLAKDFIRNHVEFMEKNLSVGAACPRATPTRKTIVTTLGSIGFLLQNENPKVIGTGGAIFRIKAIKEVKGFDTKIKGAGEDRDISHRLKESGWALSLNNSAELKHKHPPTTLRALWKRHRWYGYANHLLFHKYKDQKLLLGTYPPIAFFGGIKDSCQIYHMIQEKKVFLIPAYNFFTSTAECFGFIHAHKDGYGHFSMG